MDYPPPTVEFRGDFGARIPASSQALDLGQFATRGNWRLLFFSFESLP